MFRFQINKRLLLMKIHYFVGIGGYAPFSPFWTPIARQRGYSAFIVGLIFMLQTIPSSLVRPIAGAITDKYKCRRSVLITSSISIFLLVCMLAVIPGKTSEKEMDDMDVIKSPLFWSFFGVFTLLSVSGTVRGVLEDTICLKLLGNDKHKYGKQRLWGSIGWSSLAIISGAIIDWYSKGQTYKNYAPGFAIAIILFFIDILIVAKLEVIQETETTVTVFDMKRILTDSKVLAFLLWVVLFGFFISFIWNFLFWYVEDLSNWFHPETMPWIKTLEGLSLIIKCYAGEVPCFFMSSYILQRLDHMHVFSIMFFTYAIIFGLYGIIENPIWILPVEILNGSLYGLTFAAALSYATLVSPVGSEGTLVGIVGTVLEGIGAPIGSLVGGYMFKSVGSIESFKILSLIAFITCVVQIIVNNLINRYSKNRSTNTTSCSRIATRVSREKSTNF